MYGSDYVRLVFVCGVMNWFVRACLDVVERGVFCCSGCYYDDIGSLCAIV